MTLSPNLVEGRELWSPGGIAFDKDATPPILYVADTNNNRVLGWYYTSSLGVPSSGPFPPADIVLGQPDRYSTLLGNSQTNANGLALPTGLAIPNDGTGNLYVADSANNRIVRFPRGSRNPDLVVGQPSANFNLANQGQGQTPGQSTLWLGSNQAGIVFDRFGNLYVTDVLNSRVLRFDASVLPPAPCSANCFGPNASLVLGQNSFNTSTAQPSPFDLSGTNLVLNGLRFPSALAIDAQNRLYVGDTLSRVLVYPANVSANGSPAQFLAGQSALTAPPQTQAVLNNTRMSTPSGIFVTAEGRVGIVDSFLCRIMLFAPVDSWPSPAVRTGPSPVATVIFPQANTDIASVLPVHYINAGNAEASASTLYGPTFAFLAPTNELFIADSANHRILALPAPGAAFSAATRVFGQDQFNFMSPNLLEGREFQFTTADQNGTLHVDGGIAIDQNSNPPHLYVADTYNNRILGFNDARLVKPGVKADLVIGQPDFNRSVCNYNPNSAATSLAPTASSLCQPVGLALDSAGNLWVADRNNHRVLRFPAPFAQRSGLQPADIVLGQGAQNNFTGNALSPQSFASPYGVAINNDTDLIVSDSAFNRILIYQNQGGSWVRTKVLGQPDPNSCQANCPPGGSLNQLRGPEHVAFDSSGIIYVSDFGNGRVLIYSNPSNLSNGDAAQTYSITGLNGPSGLFVNQSTGEIWVGNTNNQSAVRYSNLDSIVRGTVQQTTIQDNIATVAVAQDQFGDLYVMDASNRIVIHYPAVLAVNAATRLIPTGSANPTPLAPGILASICPPLRELAVACRPDDLNQFGDNSASYTDLPNPIPLPSNLADTQVLVNGNPAPLLAVGPRQINFQLPMSTPTGTSLLEIVRPSTGQTLGSIPVNVIPMSPGLFYTDVHTQISPLAGSDPCFGASGICYQALANNADGTQNSLTNPALHGSTVSIFGTGQGVIPGAPADGDIAPGQVPTPDIPRVLLGSFDVTGGVSYSGLVPGQVGQWQIDFKVPDIIQAGTYLVVVVTRNNAVSNDRGKLQVTISVK